MKNITKIWRSLENRPLPSIGLVALFALLLLIPWPAGWAVRILLDAHDPKTLKYLHWGGAYFKPSGGLYFTDLRLEAGPGLVLSTARADVQFSWIQLALLQTRIERIRSEQLKVDWKVSPHSPDGDLSYAALTETHLAEILPALDSLRPILSTSGIDLDIRNVILNMGEDSLQFGFSRIEIEPIDSTWALFLNIQDPIRKPWPLPTRLKSQLSIARRGISVKTMRACWDEGCLDATGMLADSTGNSSLEMILDQVPLTPFGTLALSKKSKWTGLTRGKIQWSGRIGHPKLWKAKGNLTMTSVEFTDWPFQHEATFSSFVPQLKHSLHVDTLRIPSFDLENGKVRVDSIVVKSPQIEALARGNWTFPERLDFHLTGALSKDLYSQLPSLTKLALPRTQSGGGSFKATLAGTYTWQSINPDAEHYSTAFHNLFF